jgi:hypothetical protein
MDNQQSSDISAALSTSLRSKLCEKELNDRVSALGKSLGSRLGQLFKAGLMELWANFAHESRVEVQTISDVFPAWGLSKNGFNILQSWECSLQLVTDPPVAALSEMFKLPVDQVQNLFDNQQYNLSDLVKALSAHAKCCLTAIHIQAGSAMVPFVTEVEFSGFGDPGNYSDVIVVAISKTHIYKIFSTPSIDTNISDVSLDCFH